MKYLKLLRVFVLIMLFGGMMLFASFCFAFEPELIPREVLFGNPVKANPRISPDGKMMAYLAPVDDVRNVWVKTVGAEDDRVVTEDDDRGIRRYFWAADSKHIMYLQDIGGNENWRLYGVNLKAREIKDFTPFDNVQVRIVARDKHFPNELLIAMNKENPRVHDVYHLDLTSGELKLVAKNPGNVIGWVTDTDFKVRGAQAATPDGGFELLLRENEKANWKKLVSWDSENSLTSGAGWFSKDGNYIYLLDSRNVNAGRLVKMEIATGNIEVIAEDPQYDVADVMVHPDTYEVQAVAFYKARKELVVLDESIKGDFNAIAKLDDGDLFIIDRDNTDDTWLVVFTKDNGPVSYYAFDRKTQKGTFLFNHMPALNKYTLAPMEPISFTSRDGLTIHGYITYPPRKGRTNLPMVLNVRCAVDLCGISNLVTFMETIPPYWSTLLATFHKRVGNPETEKEFLESRSPLFKVDQIQIPILIAQGANDPRVKQEEAEQIIQAMKDKGRKNSLQSI